MLWLFPQTAYIRRYYRAYSDAQIASGIGTDASDVRKFRQRHGLGRNSDEKKKPQVGNEKAIPAFDWQVPTPHQPNSFGHLDNLVGGLCIIVALAVYVATLGPTVTGEDSGELVTAAYRMGIPHPPGYPLR